jgi:response regulator RpfG family c-di-GMP phosphodiesterase
MKTTLKFSTNSMDIEISNLKEDMQFISNSEVINDIFTNDLDKRISNLLLDKKNNRKIIGDFYITNNYNEVISSSDFSSIHKKYNEKTFFEQPIISKLTNNKVGTIYLKYSLNNLKKFLNSDIKQNYIIVNNKTKEQIKISNIKISEEIKIEDYLKTNHNIIIILSKNSSDVFNILYKYEKIFYMLFLMGIFFVYVLSYFLATKLIRPIILLSETADIITKTKDYTKRVKPMQDDEIGKLSENFNIMIQSIENSNKEVEDTQKEIIFTMGAIGETRSKETGNHVKRVAKYSELLAILYGLSEEQAECLKLASPMHDIGKVGIPDSILNKPGKFNDEERIIMNTHAELGYGMLKHSTKKLLKIAAIVAYEHHEKWDGSGYPNQLSGENIHIYGRITALADVFDALGSDRVYKKAWCDEKIFNLFHEERGKHFEPKLIDLFFENLEKFLEIREEFKDIE